MQFKNIFIATILSLVTFVSCKKDKAAGKPAVSIEGKWTGKSSILSEPFNNFYSFNINTGGLLERLDAGGTKIGQGNWEFYNDEVGIIGTYTTGGETFSIIASFDKINGKLNGTWGNGTKQYGGGYWFMNKEQ